MLPDASVAFYQAQQRRQRATLLALKREWARMGPNFDDSWRTVGPRLMVLLSAAQSGAAVDGVSYMSQVLAETGQTADLEARPNPRSLVGVASDGRPLESLLYSSVTTAKEAVSTGVGTDQGLDQGERFLEMMARTQVADAGRGGFGLSLYARPSLTGYVRMVNPPCCQRCAILAGKWFRTNTGFQRHPRCFPAGVTVSGPMSEAATRRWYEGELAVLRTASGQELPVTGNHPVLTDQGWVPANLLKVGDNVVRSLAGQGAIPLVIPDEKQAPSLIEDVWRSSGMVAFGEMPTATEDFHGDGGHGEVDVVLRDGLLWHRAQPAFTQFGQQEEFSSGVTESLCLALHGSGQEGLNGLLSSPHSGVRSSGLGESLGWSHAPGPDLTGFGHITDFYAFADEMAADDISADVEAQAKRVLALASLVRGRDGGRIEGNLTSRWDAPSGPLTMENRLGYATQGKDLGERLTRQVATDCVVKLERVSFSGHVYNLTSSEGWFSANGLIVSNCDCVHIPAAENIAGDFTTDPQKLLDGGHINDISKADRKRLDAGVPLQTVTNDKRMQFRNTRIEDLYANAPSRRYAIRVLRDLGYLT